MILDQEKISRIKTLLKFNPKGLTISDIAQALHLNRNSVAKYLEILLITGHLEMRNVGNAKVYQISQRIPISAMMAFTTAYVLVLDEEGKVLQVNDLFLTFLSCTRDELVGINVMETPLPKSILAALPPVIIKGAIREGKRGEVTVSSGSREEFLQFQIIPAVFEDGSKGAMLIFENITHRKEYERNLQLSEARYRGIVEDQTELICRRSPGGQIRFVNSAFCSFFGVSPIDVEGTDLFRISRPLQPWGEDIKEATGPLAGQYGEVVTAEEAVDIPGRGIRWLQWTERAIRDSKGDITEYQRVGRDITERKRTEEDLRVSRHAMDSSINAIGITDLSGNVTYVNQAFLDMWGFQNKEEIVGQPVRSFARNDGISVKEISEIFKNISDCGGWIGEKKATRKNGEPFYNQVSATVVRDSQGIPVAFMASIIDITSRWKAEDDLYLKECALTASITGIGIFDLSGRLVYANMAFLKFFELPSSPDVYGLPFERLYEEDPSAIPAFLRLREEVIEKGSWFGEIQLDRRDNTPVIIQVAATLSRDRNGTPVSLMMSVVDISAQRSVELAYRTIYEKLQDTIEFIPDPTLIVDRDHRVIAWNRAMESLAGVPKGKAIGRSDISRFFTFLSGIRPLLVDLMDMSADQIARKYPMVRRFGDSLFVECYIPALNQGRGGYLWGKASVLTDENGVIGAIESFRDVTQWKKAEESIRQGSPSTKAPSLDNQGE